MNCIFSAAHCVMNKEGQGSLDSMRNQLLPRQILVLLGAYMISKSNEEGRVAAPVWKIFIHDDWSPAVLNYDADIAMLLLEEDVHTSRFIKPICVPQDSTDVSMGENFVAGWGQTEETKSPATPKMAMAPIVNNSVCFRHRSELYQIASGRTFCAGTADGAGVCLGDSGHGLFTQVNEVFYLNGIVSSSLVSAGGSCDVTTYAIYTNVVKYAEWISNVIARN